MQWTVVLDIIFSHIWLSMISCRWTYVWLCEQNIHSSIYVPDAWIDWMKSISRTFRRIRRRPRARPVCSRSYYYVISSHTSFRSKSWAAADINTSQKFKLCLRYLLLPTLNISMMLLSSILMENCLMIFFLHIIFFNIRFFHLHFFPLRVLCWAVLCCFSFCRSSSFSF